MPRIRAQEIIDAIHHVRPGTTVVFKDDGDGTVSSQEHVIRLADVPTTEWQALAKGLVDHKITMRPLFDTGHPFYGESFALRRTPSRGLRAIVDQ